MVVSHDSGKYRRMFRASWLLGFSLLLFAGTANATMRCGTALISLGDTAAVVREKCGSPDSSVDQVPVARINNGRRVNPVKVSLWVYGPRNGAFQHLKFIEDKLVKIDTRRD